jgi:hypothetical protein
MEEARLVLVTGGRDFADRDAVFRALDTVLRKYPNTSVLHGACDTGADAHAQAWAVERQRPFIGVPAEWLKYDLKAGPIRNSLLIGYLPHACVAFPGGAGTADMVRKAEAAKIPVWRP